MSCVYGFSIRYVYYSEQALYGLNHSQMDKTDSPTV